jgi:hypothetical protein
MPNVQEAIAIVHRVSPALPAGSVALVIAIAGVESGIGNGFLPYHNWGAETAGGSWTGDTFEHEDKRWTPAGVVSYVTNFRAYPDDDAAALGLVTLLRSQYSAALTRANAGDWRGAAAALYKDGYYKGVKPPAGAIADEYAALSRWLKQQGINPAAALGAAALVEMAFWTGLALLGFKAAKKVR